MQHARLVVDAGVSHVSAQAIAIRVADVGFRITSACEHPLSLAGAMASFVTSGDSEYSVQLRVFQENLSQYSRRSSSKKVFDSNGLWWLEKNDDKDAWFFSTPVLGETPYRKVIMDPDYRSGVITLHAPYLKPRQTVYPMEYPLDEMLMVHILARHNLGVELHGCGMITPEGRGILFLGKSGAGKTTTANLWRQQYPHLRILSDDRIVVRFKNGRMHMYGTPWHGEGRYALPEDAPLCAVFFLKQDTTNTVCQLSRGEQVARLFSASFVPAYAHETIAPSLSFLDKLVDCVPCRLFGFVKERAAVIFIEQLLRVDT